MFRLQETPYTEWINGECIADRVCFQQEEGRVAGPFRGPFGWYLTRLNRRIPPSQALHVDDTKIRERLKDDYVRWAFIQYSKEAVAQAEVRGWKPL
jgi:parvulin-like peptidyl-prolyl isomerase